MNWRRFSPAVGVVVEVWDGEGVRYHTQHAGEWVQPRRRGYYMKCCDCGLVHRLNFRLVRHGRGRKIQFQAFRIKKRGRKRA
jgi:hypothetical protein